MMRRRRGGLIDYVDSPDLQIAVLAAVGALLVALAVFGLTAGSEPAQSTTIPTTVYTHYEEVTP